MEIQKAGPGFLVWRGKTTYFRRTFKEASELAASFEQSNGAAKLEPGCSGNGLRENVIERLRYGLSLMEAEIEGAERGELAGPKTWVAQQECEREGGEGRPVWTGNGFKEIEWWDRFKRDTGVKDKAGFSKLAKLARGLMVLLDEAERRAER